MKTSVTDTDINNFERLITAEELDTLFRKGKLVRIGDGSRRVCYTLPGGTFCVKSYRSEEELDTRMRPDGTLEKHHLKPSVIREIRKARFDEKHNTSCKEYRYGLKLKKKLPVELFAAFPERVEQIFVPSRGWCLIENIVQNADGTPVKKFAVEYKVSNKKDRSAMLFLLESFLNKLIQYKVKFYDPQNVMVQFDAGGNFKLRIVDFEPVSRTFISLDSIFPFVAAHKLQRRMLRFKKYLKEHIDGC
jgi:hypothetical protein